MITSLQTLAWADCQPELRSVAGLSGSIFAMIGVINPVIKSHTITSLVVINRVVIGSVGFRVRRWQLSAGRMALPYKTLNY
ncbi:hypothetical protein [Hahella ganghwensis]|uniref:hypothetical protein n=1 Tax=Hahella ganghwensis TaxID=286420 RepID=UPI0003661675|nr:hypothetical protein [Hahella ganghwensis]